MKNISPPACKIFVDGKPLEDYLEEKEKNQATIEYEKEIRDIGLKVKKSIFHHIKPKYDINKKKLISSKKLTDEEIRKEYGIMSKSIGTMANDIAWIVKKNSGKEISFDTIKKELQPKNENSARTTFLSIMNAFNFSWRIVVDDNNPKRRNRFYKIEIPDNYDAEMINQKVIESRWKYKKEIITEKKQTPYEAKNIIEQIKKSMVPGGYSDFISEELTKALGKKASKLKIEVEVRFGFIKET